MICRPRVRFYASRSLVFGFVHSLVCGFFRSLVCGCGFGFGFGFVAGSPVWVEAMRTRPQLGGGWSVRMEIERRGGVTRRAVSLMEEAVSEYLAFLLSTTACPFHESIQTASDRVLIRSMLCDVPDTIGFSVRQFAYTPEPDLPLVLAELRGMQFDGWLMAERPAYRWTLETMVDEMMFRVSLEHVVMHFGRAQRVRRTPSMA